MVVACLRLVWVLLSHAEPGPWRRCGAASQCSSSPKTRASPTWPACLPPGWLWEQEPWRPPPQGRTPLPLEGACGEGELETGG